MTHDPRPTLFFDGDCGLCDRFVRFVAARDEGRFTFVSLQSATARSMLSGTSAPTDGSTIVLLDRGRLSVRSTAVLRVCGALQGPWSKAAAFLVVPRPLRDGVYRSVAAIRRRVPAPEACSLPPAGLAARTVLD